MATKAGLLLVLQQQLSDLSLGEGLSIGILPWAAVTQMLSYGGSALCTVMSCMVPDLAASGLIGPAWNCYSAQAC